MRWNDDQTITIVPPKKPKKITGTRFAAIMGLNVWSTPFEAWCAITRTYEEPFEDTKYTIAGKAIEPKQAEFLKTSYFMENLITPEDMYGKDFKRATMYDFFHESKEFGGMWDFLLADEDGVLDAVIEMKTTKRSEDWADDIPEYYALQAALYAYLLGVDSVIMCCSFLEEDDYEHPEKYVPTVKNTIVRPFKLSERYPDMEKTIKQMQKWWKTHVEGGVSPAYDEKRDADILKVLRDTNYNPETDVAALVEEAEELTLKLDENEQAMKEITDRLKVIKDILKESMKEKFKDGDKTVTLNGKTFDFVLAKSERTTIDKNALAEDGILEDYQITETQFRFNVKKRKEKD